MATSTTTTFKPFDLNKALGGASVGFNENGTPFYVFNLGVSGLDPTFKDKFYSGIGQDSEVYFFDREGTTPEGKQLSMIVSTINTTSGTVGSRGDGDESISVDINSLQPREEFAKTALIGLLGHESNPLSIDDAKIARMTAIAFKIASGMMNTAADYREITNVNPAPPVGDKEISVDTNALTSNSDKLLSNINENIKTLIESVNVFVNAFNSVVDSTNGELRVKQKSDADILTLVKDSLNGGDLKTVVESIVDNKLTTKEPEQ